MVDHETPRQARDLRLEARQLAPVELNVGVPAERVNARRDLVQHIEAERAGVERHDAHAAYAGKREPLEIGLGNARTHDGDGTCLGPGGVHARDAVERGTVVVSVSVGLHHDDARKAEPPLHRQVLVYRARTRHGRAGRHRAARVVKMDVRVGGAGWRYEFRGLHDRGFTTRNDGALPSPHRLRSCLVCAAGSVVRGALELHALHRHRPDVGRIAFNDVVIFGIRGGARSADAVRRK